MSDELNQTPTKKPSILQNLWVRASAVVAAVLIIAGVIIYFQMSSSEVGIDDSLVSAQAINLSPTSAGQLQEVDVQEGQFVPANTVVASVGTELIKTQIAGIITSVPTTIGATYSPGQPVVTMIDPTQLRIVGTIDENKGLDRLSVGQLASFTVDAFGSQKFEGVVDEISPSANQQDIVFNISDQRQTQQFDVKVRFDTQKYSQLKNGMSAKLTIYTK